MRIERALLLYEITPAKLLYEHTPARMQVSVTRGGFSIESEPVRMEIDNKQFFDSIGIKGLQSQAKENIQRGKEAALETAGRYTRQKNAMTGPDAVNISQIVMQTDRAPAKTKLAFLPEAKPQVSFSGGEVHMHYLKDKVEIDWKAYELNFTYIPYSVAFKMQKR